jgi:hypothetical protein
MQRMASRSMSVAIRRFPLSEATRAIDNIERSMADAQSGDQSPYDSSVDVMAPIELTW